MLTSDGLPISAGPATGRITGQKLHSVIYLTLAATQLIAIDGVSISVPPGTAAGALITMSGGKFTVIDCPPSNTGLQPVCVRDLVMMPSSRAEVWVTYRNVDGAVVEPPPDTRATLRQGIINLGPAAEAWPEFKLAKVEFAHRGAERVAVDVAGNAAAVLSGKGIPGSMPAHAESALVAAHPCQKLADGHRRRVFFGMEDPTNSNARFGLGYEEIIHQEGVAPENQAVVSGTQMPVSAYDPARAPICVSLGPGGSPVRETWELVNLATESHNFHIHQAKFRVVDAAALAQTLQSASDSAVVVEDNVPVPFAVANSGNIADNQNGYCTIEQWRNRQCTSQPIVIDIPFSQTGEFLYHCHILEHEDGGMMAKIQVVP